MRIDTAVSRDDAAFLSALTRQLQCSRTDQKLINEFFYDHICVSVCFGCGFRQHFLDVFFTDIAIQCSSSTDLFAAVVAELGIFFLFCPGKILGCDGTMKYRNTVQYSY
jgi:hypothetical protein